VTARAAAAVAPTRTLEEIRQEYDRSWRLNQLRDGMARGRRDMEGTTRVIAELRACVTQREAYLASLMDRRTKYMEELLTLPQDTLGDAAAHRRHDLLAAVEALDGTGDVMGTCCATTCAASPASPVRGTTWNRHGQTWRRRRPSWAASGTAWRSRRRSCGSSKGGR
jgi:hypothetical protein